MMISQSDIIRSLVNKNCTDEAIMSTALSPDCTLPKLLQKFTEAERFDLALDVYMKLGMDVVPLWKTWAMRCLRSRDFQGAREKFKHCFQRLRSSAGRFGAATSGLLDSILRELTRMQEIKLPLSEEIELIVNSMNRTASVQVASDTSAKSAPKINETKPKIFGECMHYLKEYGTTELLIKFYVDNDLWHEAIATLFETRATRQDKSDKFFVAHLVIPSETSGHLDEVVADLLELDPQIEQTSSYFKALYEHLSKRHHSLYYVQHEIGDHVRAAESQVRNFFLRRPTQSYKELNTRLSSLISANEEYNQHLARLAKEVDGIGSEPGQSNLSFIARLSRQETELKLKIIDTQMDITRNFAINEVTGCMGSIDVVCGPDQRDHRCCEVWENHESPVTLFDGCMHKRTFLAALILIYFDLDCANYISDSGFELANKLINEDDLDKLSVFKTAMNIIIDDESSDILENASLLLKRLREDYIACTQRTRLKQTPAANHLRRGPSGNSVSAGARSNSEADSGSLSKNVISRPRESEKNVSSRAKAAASSPTAQARLSLPTNRIKKKAYNFEPPDKSIRPGSDEAARLLCDEVIRNAIRSCREEDYKTELVKLLSPEAKVVLYIELGKLSVAQRLAFEMMRPDYVKMVLSEATRLNQDHVKDMCQHWLAKH